MERGKTSAVQIPESEDTLQIMTIHKSKGLEFPVVPSSRNREEKETPFK